MDKKKDDYYFNMLLNLMRTTYMNLEKQWQINAMEVGLSYAQQHALWILHIQDGLTLEELGNIAMWNKSTTSALITKLEHKDYVKKESEEDGTRGFRIFLTPKGQEVLSSSVATEGCISFMGLFKDLEESKFVDFLENLHEISNIVGDKYFPEKQKDFNKYLEEYSNNLLK